MEPIKEKSLAKRLEIFDRLREFLQHSLERKKRKMELEKSKPLDQYLSNESHL